MQGRRPGLFWNRNPSYFGFGSRFCSKRIVLHLHRKLNLSETLIELSHIISRQATCEGHSLATSNLYFIFPSQTHSWSLVQSQMIMIIDDQNYWDNFIYIVSPKIPAGTSHIYTRTGCPPFVQTAGFKITVLLGPDENLPNDVVYRQKASYVGFMYCPVISRIK